jgi:hypothetical protein
MTSRRSRVGAGFLFALVAAWAIPSGAHEFKMDAVMNAFLKVEAKEAHLVIRAPLFLFKSIRFPVKGPEIDIDQSGPALARALEAIQKDVTVFENGRPLTPLSARARLSLPTDRSFESFEDARSHIAWPPEPGVGILSEQGYVDAHLSYAITSPGDVYSVRTTAAPELGDYLKLAVRYILPDGAVRAMVITSRSGTVRLNPTWTQAAAGFIGAGIAHIATGFDHLLFLLCVVIPLRGWRQIVTVVTGFTIAHSLTLLGSAFGLTPGGAWFPPFVETVIALSIVYMALEDIIGVDFRRRILLTMLFGLVHGFGFSYGLREDLQFAGSHLVVSLLAFNIGIEIGQILVLLVMLPALAVVTRYVLPGRAGTIILAAIVAHVGWHWMEERWDALAKVRWPAFDAANLATLLFWLAGLALAGALIVYVVSRLRLEPPAPRKPGRRFGAGSATEAVAGSWIRRRLSRF